MQQPSGTFDEILLCRDNKEIMIVQASHFIEKNATEYGEEKSFCISFFRRFLVRRSMRMQHQK